MVTTAMKLDFPGSSVSKESAYSARDTRNSDSIPGSRRSPEEENGNPLQYSCLENSMGRGAWRAAVQGVAKSRIQLSKYHFHTSIVFDSPTIRDVSKAGL